MRASQVVHEWQLPKIAAEVRPRLVQQLISQSLPIAGCLAYGSAMITGRPFGGYMDGAAAYDCLRRGCRRGTYARR
jgi:hypothetical protein